MRTLLVFSSVCVALLTGCGSSAPIRPASELPATTPWDLRALSRPPALEWLDGTSAVRSLLYEGEPYQNRPTKVFAHYATPGTLAGDRSMDRDLPAIVLVHGGGGTAFREWVEMWARRGYAAIAMDLRGQRPVEGLNAHDMKNRQTLDEAGPMQSDGHIFFAIDQPVTEHWPYHAVANVIRAHSLVRSFSEVDAQRTAVTGISWGGYLTCIAASLDNRFRAAVPVYGCGFLHENSAWLDHFKRLGLEKANRWVELYDPSRYLPACRVPIFFVNGTNDFAYPLDSYMKSYQLVRHAPRNIRVTVNMLHSHPHGWEPREIGIFIDHHLNGTDPLPQVHLSESGQISGLEEVGVTGIAAHFTVDSTNPINKRSWQTVQVFASPDPVTLESWRRLEVSPAEGSLAWFITVTDAQGATVSSEVTIVPDGILSRAR